ncbi:TetR/AcrR family transcriptional regulator [Bacilliculturomica massiliensis]|uniref:TetR/AcrR family transcriptional regulator n=1 Tax=Bacilliculturomica massiliensis TaxID=1917867 RepID=UPI001031F357|nr:TetR/AcrR family transcriptional regulator [Bacilliculturomica massiliensis]
MPKIGYSEAEREKIREALIDTGLKLFSGQGIQHTTVEQIYTRVGISRTFFYSFFPAKEDLVVQAFYRQQPQMLAYAQKLMDDASLDWRDGVGQFLHNVCYGGESRFAIMSVEEQQALSKCLSGENRQEFQKRRLRFFTELLHVFGVDVEPQTVKLLGNLVFSAAILHKAVPDTLPFLFADAADEMTAFQIRSILDYMETLRRQ